MRHHLPGRRPRLFIALPLAALAIAALSLLLGSAGLDLEMIQALRGPRVAHFLRHV